MLKAILDFIESFFKGSKVKMNIKKQNIKNSPNSVNIIGDNNNVTKGPHICVDNEQEALVIKEIE